MNKSTRVSSERISGIYQIRNTVNSKAYIGSSKDIYGRWVQHKRDFNKNDHANPMLQKAWNKYGSYGFEFSILETLQKEDVDRLFDREEFWIHEKMAFDRKRGYNYSQVSRNASCGTTTDILKEGKRTIPYDKFIAIINLLQYTTVSIPKIADALKVNERTVYQIYFKDQYKDVTEGMIFRKRPHAKQCLMSEDDVKEIIAQLFTRNNHEIANDYGVSPNTISDIRLHRTWGYLTHGISFPGIHKKPAMKNKPIIQMLKDGTVVAEYESAHDADRQTGMSFKQISRVCLHQRPYAFGFRWEFT